MTAANGGRSSSGGSEARSAARLLAVQALYQIAINGGSADATILEFLQHRGGAAEAGDEEDEFVTPRTPERALFADIVRGVARDRTEIDALIAGSLDAGRSVERLEPLLLAILCAGTYELRSRPDVPARVVISEYVDVADAFFEAREPGLVNAVLDRAARVLRSDELPPAARSGDGAAG